ncbi:SDR family NAD(P)-dependent oxidoreductase [Lentzea cavernae]|uniref:Dehydrogenase n=1 Tax=Lentzea cavernae TaxID=2020703 RepID=A0ABQ3M716_9PSEU|nr:SDR family oxidoreductase [Lentzea cavernae]GHH30801.1 dehydrogenase [Lentzea cavernae]
MSFSGSTALITGASKGLGVAYARELASRGADLVLVARSADALEGLAQQLREAHGVRVEVIAADLAHRDGPGRVEDELRRREIEVDLLLNNAGAGSVGPFLDRPFDAQLASVDLNVTGLMTLTHRLGGRMRARGSGGIINVSSTAAFQPLAYQAVYAATKAFVLSFSEALAEELAGTGVKVMAAHPGAIATGFFDGTTAKMAGSADSPEVIAAQTLDDFTKGRHASYPGRWVNRVQTWAARSLPRRRVAVLGAWFNRKMGFGHVSDVEPVR